MMEYQEKSNSISTIIEVNESSEFSKTNKSFKSNLTQSIVNTSMYSHKYKSKSYNKSIYNSVEDSNEHNMSLNSNLNISLIKNESRLGKRFIINIDKLKMNKIDFKSIIGDTDAYNDKQN